MVLKKLQSIKELFLASQNDKVVTLLNENVAHMRTALDKNLGDMRQGMDVSSRALNERLDNAGRVISAVQHELGGMKEIGRAIQEFQSFLKSPKLRGSLGEEILYDALKQCIPQEQYDTQYKFTSGQTVDAVIKTSGGLIPIDSKFPMDNYAQMLKAEDEQTLATAKRDFVNAVRKHTRDIAQKYILPQEGTVNFALMYVPSEAIFYEILVQYEELTQYARELHVTPVSPNGLYQYLYIILMGIERSKLETEAGRVWELVKGLQQESRKFSEKLSVLSRHVTNAKSAMDGVSSDYEALDRSVQGVRLLD